MCNYSSREEKFRFLSNAAQRGISFTTEDDEQVQLNISLQNGACFVESAPELNADEVKEFVHFGVYLMRPSSSPMSTSSTFPNTERQTVAS